MLFGDRFGLAALMRRGQATKPDGCVYARRPAIALFVPVQRSVIDGAFNRETARPTHTIA